VFFEAAAYALHMTLNTKVLIGLHVRTQSGTALGKVGSLDLDADTGHLQNLHVKTPGIVHGLLNDELAVSWGQVVSMDEKEVVVKDGTVPMGSKAIAAAKPEAAAGIQVSARESDA
jgi:sporulation protein YlmC with PRC-barrel domain